MITVIETNKCPSLEIINGPRQYAFDKIAVKNGQPITLRLTIGEHQITVEAEIKFSSLPTEGTMLLIGLLRNSDKTDFVKDFLKIDAATRNQWNIYFSSVYKIQEGTGVLYPFLLNSTTTELYNKDRSLRPAAHPFNNNIIVAWPLPLKIIIEYQKELAIKQAIDEALEKASNPASCPEESADMRIARLKAEIEQIVSGNIIEKKIIFWLLDQTQYLTKPAGFRVPENNRPFGLFVLRNIVNIFAQINWTPIIKPYFLEVRWRDNSFVIYDLDVNVNPSIKLHEFNMAWLNEII